MKTLHVPFCFYPDPIGGTEVYVESLAHHLQHQGASVVIAAPGQGASSYEHKGLAVLRFVVSEETSDIRDLYGDGDLPASQEFARILDEEQPDVVHLHAFTRGASLRMVREAKRRRIKVVFTYHTPTVSCQRGTLMRWGAEICDGVLDLQRCCACTLHGRGLVKPLANAVASLPLALSSLPGKFGLQSGMWTALRMAELVTLRHSAFRALMQEVDYVVALCQWTKDLLMNNGVPAEKITVSRHGLAAQRPEVGVQTSDVTEQRARWKNANGERNSSDSDISNLKSEIRNPKFPLRIAFLGRLDPTKGPDILIRALRSLPNAPVELHLYGIAQGQGGPVYLQELKNLAAGDSRIAFLPAVSSHQVIELLRGYDLLAVPSRWLETGPLVALEAFAAGTPLIGSDLGGIAELVDDEINGILIDTDSIEAWSQAIHRCCDDRAFLEHLRRGVCPPRGMDAVADEMLSLYRQAVKLEKADNEYGNREVHADS